MIVPRSLSESRMHGSICQHICGGLLGLVVAGACLGTAGLRLSAADLQYAFRPGVRFTYTYEIEAELDDKVGLFRGTNAYRVEANAGPGAPGKMVEATGTGFFVAEGHLVTCAHVVNKATRISVHVGTTDLLGKVVGMDLGKDLAVVQVGAKNVPLLPLGATVAMSYSARILMGVAAASTTNIPPPRSVTATSPPGSSTGEIGALSGRMPAA